MSVDYISGMLFPLLSMFYFYFYLSEVRRRLQPHQEQEFHTLLLESHLFQTAVAGDGEVGEDGADPGSAER